MFAMEDQPTRATTRRVVMAGGTALLLTPLAAVAGCGGAAPAVPSTQPVTLRWWSYFGPNDRGRLFDPVSNDYRAQHPNVSFEMGHALQDYDTKLAASFAAGDPPELFGTTHTTILARAKEGNLLDLGSWYGQANRKKAVHPAAQAWTTVNGKLVGLSAHDCFAQEWYCNAGIFDELKLAEPKSSEDLISVASRLRGRGLKHPLLLTNDATRMGFFAAVQAQTLGSTALQRAIEQKNYNLPGITAAFQALETMHTRGAVALETVDLGSPTNAVANGEGGIAPLHTGYYPGLKRAVDNAGIVRLGLFKEAVLFTSQPLSKWSAGWGMVWAIPKSTKLAKEAQDFLGFWAAVPVQRRLAAEGIGIPPFPEVWDALTDPILRGTVDHLKEASGESLYMIDFLAKPVIDAWYAGMTGIARRQKSIKEAIDGMNAAAQAA